MPKVQHIQQFIASDLCQLYNFYTKILAHCLKTVYILEMTRNVLDNLNHQILQYHEVKMSNLERVV